MDKLIPPNRVIVFPGSFDPVTYGHIDLIQRLSCVFDKVIVLICISLEKEYLFSVSEKQELLVRSLENLTNVNVDNHSGLTVDYMKQNDYKLLARGVRSLSDFEMEMTLAQMNRSLEPQVETFFMSTSPKYSFVASRYIKEVAKLGGDLKSFVPEIVEEALKNKINI